MASDEMDTADVLDAAAGEVTRSGLHKRWFWKDSKCFGPCCAVGAIRRVTGEIDDIEERSMSAIVAAESYLKLSGCKQLLTKWNDEPERTAADVAAMFNAAAARLRLGAR